MERGRYVVLSTTHVRHATAELLVAWSEPPATERPLAIAGTEGGWFLPTFALADGEDTRLPAELLSILQLARREGCSYVLLDCDGPVIDALVAFPR